MPRNLIHYEDFETPVNEWRFRLMVIPADVHSIPLSVGDPPAWDTDADIATGWRRLPERVLMASPMSLSEAGHDGVMVGIHSLPTLKIAFNLWFLTGTTADNDLRKYLIRPKMYAGGELFGRLFPTTNTFKLLTDRGDRSRNVESDGDDSFFTYFIGAQQAGLDNTFEVDEVSESAPLELEIQNLLYLCLSTVKTVDVVACIDAGVTAGDYSAERTNVLYDGIWHTRNDESENKFHWAGQRGGLLPMEMGTSGGIGGALGGSKVVESEQQEAEMYRLTEMWHAMYTCASTVYQQYIRASAAAEYVAFRSRQTATGPVISISATGFDNWEMLKHSYHPNGLPGTATYLSNVWFDGWIYDKDDHKVGGYFFDGGTPDRSPGLRKWVSVYDYCEDAFRGGIAKVKIEPVLNGSQWVMYFGGMFENLFDRPIVSGEDFLEKPKATPGAFYTPGATVDLPTRWDDDPSNYENKDTEQAPDLNLSLVMHNLPDSRDYGKSPRLFHYTAAGTDFDGPALGVYQLGFRTSTLYYRDTPDFMTHAVFVRVHEMSRLWMGTGWAHQLATPTPYPVFSAFTADMFESSTGQVTQNWHKHVKENFADKVTEAFIGMAYNGGFGYLGSLYIPRFFGDDQQTEYSTSVPLDVLTWHDISQRCNEADFPTGNVMATGITWAYDMPGAPIITRTADDIEHGVTAVRFFAVDPLTIAEG